jgi:hypothetical protein
VEHLSLPDDPASRRLFGVPIVATVSEAAGVGHVLAVDAVVARALADQLEPLGRQRITDAEAKRQLAARGERAGGGCTHHHRIAHDRVAAANSHPAVERESDPRAELGVGDGDHLGYGLARRLAEESTVLRGSRDIDARDRRQPDRCVP